MTEGVASDVASESTSPCVVTPNTCPNCVNAPATAPPVVGAEGPEGPGPEGVVMPGPCELGLIDCGGVAMVVNDFSPLCASGEPREIVR